MTKINIILLGESGVGKTTLLLRFKTGEFSEINPVTHAVEFHVKKIFFEGKEVTIFIWDTSGQEKYNSVVRSYYRQGDGVLLVYDVTNPATFYTLSKWLCDLKNLNEGAEILIAGNKNEDPTKKTVAVSMVKNFAKQENLQYIEMSAMSGSNVEEAFLYLAKKVLIAKGIIQDRSDHLSSNGLLANNVEQNNTSDEKDGKIKLEEAPSTSASTSKKSSSCC